MTYVGIDIEQFTHDPYGTGIQRVLQYLARCWPASQVQADFVVPNPARSGEFLLLSPDQAVALIAIAFEHREPDSDVQGLVREKLAAFVEEREVTTVKLGDLVSLYDSWLLPEVSYLPSVLERFEIFRRCMHTVMIGYDTLPMTEPANYRFKPGNAAWVSEYFRMLAVADAVVCISDYARDSILDRLRRDRALPIFVAHPGGDHLDVRGKKPSRRTRFVRLGTLEARKQPLEILGGFKDAADAGLDAELLFIGKKSSSDEAINQALLAAIDAGYPVTWVQGASDEEVYELVNGSDLFLSIGIEGYGIPVLEAIRLGVPVIFAGVQPAGELMQGHGARRIDAATRSQLQEAFLRFGSQAAREELAEELDSVAVPTWTQFALQVAAATTY
ncbi:MAG: glycosyltransferase [Actinomycetota bacterium]|nr:glycosyltransferase [Actinomycetota bacterium]MDP2287414.1 glycosyltransferase [Actinomycetota bacterium]